MITGIITERLRMGTILPENKHSSQWWPRLIKRSKIVTEQQNNLNTKVIRVNLSGI